MSWLIKFFESDKVRKYGGLISGFLAFLLFAKVVSFGFSNYDDNIYLTSNEFVKTLSLKNIAYIFTHQFYGHYFPITLTFSAFQYFFFGDWAGGYHIVNLIVHSINAILLFEILKKLDFKVAHAFIGTLVFGLHPLQVETIGWLGATNNVLATFFMFSAWLYYFTYLKQPRFLNYILVFVLFVLACLSKSSAIILPIILILTDFLKENRDWFRIVLSKIPLFFISILFGIISVKAAKHFGSVAPVLDSYSWFNVPFLVLFQLSFYGFQFLFPLNLKIRYNNPIETNGLLPNEYYWSALLIFVFLGFFLFAKNKKQVLFLLAWFVVGIGLTLKFRFSTNVIGADRYAYFFISVFALIILNLKIPKGIKYGFFTIFLVVSGSLSYARLNVWSTSKTLFQDLVEHADGDSKPFLFRGLNFIKEKQYEAALLDLQTAISIDSNSAKNRNAFATANLLLGKNEMAERQYLKAIELDSSLANPYFHLGNIYGSRAQYQKAKEYFISHLKLNPTHGETYFWLGNIEIINENYFQALQQYLKAEQHHYNSAVVQINIGFCYTKLDEVAKGCAAFIKAKEMGATNADALISKYCV